MIKYEYLIADLFFHVQADNAFVYAQHNKFSIRDDSCIFSPTDANSVQVYCEIDPAIGSYYPSDSGIPAVVTEKKEGGYFVYLRDETGSIAHIVKADGLLKSWTITTSSEQKMPFEGSAGEVLFRTSLLCCDGIVIHSSAIELDGNGILFSAPSGTGKSTQANLWREHKGAVVLNGDRPALRTLDGSVYVYGTLWSGVLAGFKKCKGSAQSHHHA